MELDIYKDWFNKLIGSELIAFLQYEFASHLVIGTDYDSCTTEFKKHADEERKHMNDLMDYAISRDIFFNQDIPTLLMHAEPIYEYMEGLKSAKLVKFHFISEEKAIKTYKEFYELIKEEDITLAKLIKNIIRDEIEHRKDLKKIYSSISDGKMLYYDKDIYKNFSELSFQEKISKIAKLYRSKYKTGIDRKKVAKLVVDSDFIEQHDRADIIDSVCNELMFFSIKNLTNRITKLN